MMSKEQILDTKARLAEAVAKKKSLTQQRMALKRIPFKTRSGEEHALMMALRGLASDQKEAVRVLQLAYAYARGRAFWTQERKGLTVVNGGTLGRLAVYIERVLPVKGEDVLLWMRAPVDDMARVAFAAHEQAARTAALAARTARALDRTRLKTAAAE